LFCLRIAYWRWNNATVQDPKRLLLPLSFIFLACGLDRKESFNWEFLFLIIKKWAFWHASARGKKKE